MLFFRRDISGFRQKNFGGKKNRRTPAQIIAFTSFCHPNFWDTFFCHPKNFDSISTYFFLSEESWTDVIFVYPTGGTGTFFFCPDEGGGGGCRLEKFRKLARGGFSVSKGMRKWRKKWENVVEGMRKCRWKNEKMSLKE